MGGAEVSDKEFVSEIRRGLITIMRAMIRKYCMAWLDFLPKDYSFGNVPENIDVTERGE
jgi:hypothetical protein